MHACTFAGKSVGEFVARANMTYSMGILNVSPGSWELGKSPLHTSTLQFLNNNKTHMLNFHTSVVLTILDIQSHSWEPKYCLNTRTHPGSLKSWKENRRDGFGNLNKDYNTSSQKKDATSSFKERIMLAHFLVLNAQPRAGGPDEQAQKRVLLATQLFVDELVICLVLAI